MSALSYICGYGYGSNSDDSDCEYPKTNTKRAKLPAPDLTKVPVVSTEAHEDDPELHGGRTRSFPHVRGNWATFVYVKYPEGEDMLKLVQKLQNIVVSVDESCQTTEDLHISLSRTVVLNYHIITPFSTSLQAALAGIQSFDLSFDSLKVYCNDDKTRTFIALKVDPVTNKSLLQVSQKIDEILVDFKLPTFYEDASFHMSILWLNGNKTAEVTNILEKLNKIVVTEIGNSLNTVSINKVNCKSGNKHYQYPLEYHG